jgi:hypothetical protein
MFYFYKCQNVVVYAKHHLEWTNNHSSLANLAEWRNKYLRQIIDTSINVRLNE